MQYFKELCFEFTDIQKKWKTVSLQKELPFYYVLHAPLAIASEGMGECVLCR
jgi:hypothetical protein